MKFEVEFEVLEPLILGDDKRINVGLFKIDGNKLEVYRIDEEFNKKVNDLDTKELLSDFATKGNLNSVIVEMAKREGKVKVETHEYERIEKVNLVNQIQMYNRDNAQEFIKEAIGRFIILDAPYNARNISYLCNTKVSGFKINKKELVRCYNGTLCEAVAKGEILNGTIELDYDLKEAMKDLLWGSTIFDSKEMIAMNILSEAMKYNKENYLFTHSKVKELQGDLQAGRDSDNPTINYGDLKLRKLEIVE